MAIEKVTFKQMMLILIKLVTVLREKNVFLPREKHDFRIKSNSFKSGGKIPKKFTPYGKDIHPDFYFTGIPRHTKSFAIICDDPDTPSGEIFTHWVVKNIPLNVQKIEEGEQVGEEIKNSWGFTRYSGPKPPSGTHRYFFKLYAIREDKLVARTLNALRKEIEAKKVGEAKLMGIYSKE